MITHYTKYNFHKNTFCIFTKIDFELIQNLKINYKSKSGSSYIFTDEGVYRIANHWGRTSNCRWRLEGGEGTTNQKYAVGYARWSDFYDNDEVSNLFFILIDYSKKTAQFYHKNSGLYQDNFQLRNAKDTSKTIKIIHQVLQEQSWSKHLTFDDLDVLREQVCNQLQCSNLTFIQIKNKFMK